MTDAQFMQLVLIPYAGTVGGKLNLERLMLTPLLQDEDEFFFDMLSVRINPMTSLLDDPSPPFMLYRANPNQEQNGVNPYAATSYEDRWYRVLSTLPLLSSKSPGAERADLCFARVRSTCARY